MKKFLAILLSVMMLASIALPGTALAAGEDAVFTISSVSGNPGDEIKVKVTLKTSQAVNSIAFNSILFDESVLEFVGFSGYEHFNGKTVLPIENMADVANKTIMVALTAAEVQDGDYCTLDFKIKENAAIGETTITAGSVVKNGSTTYTSAVVPATVKVLGKDFTGLTFDDATYTYDGTEKTVELKGYPQGATVNYENNGKVNAGTYTVKATVTAPGYNKYEDEAVLKINKAALKVEGLVAANKEYDGTTAAVLSGGELKGVAEADKETVKVEAFPTAGTFASKNAGNNIAVTFDDIVISGDWAANYTFEQPTVKANITKKQLTVTAISFGVKIGDEITELEHETVGLVEGDAYEDVLTGEPTHNANTAREGTYNITQGTLKLKSPNYTLTFVPGTITVSDKTVQGIEVSEIPQDVVYGGESFKVEAIADETAQLSDFAYASSNEAVATIDAEGNVTIVGAGETDITVTEPGNEDYAAFEKVQKLVVAQKEVEVISVDLDAKTAVIDGILDADREAVALDFDKLVLETVEADTPAEDENGAENSEPEAQAEGENPEGENPEGENPEGENPEAPADITVKVTNFVLTGDKAANYKVATEELETTIAADNMVTVELTAEAGGTVTGAGSYIKNSSVAIKATANTGYNFIGWYLDGVKVEELAAEDVLVVDEDIALVAKFAKQPSSGGAGGGLQAGGDTSNKGADQFDNVQTDNNDAAGEITIPGTSTDTGSFADLGGYDWAKDAIENLAEQGIIKGTSASTYAPAANINRADFAALIVRLFNLTSDNTENFADVDANDYFAAELAIARNTGVVSGIGDNKFAPRNSITRQDMMVMIYRAMTALSVELAEAGEVAAADFDTVAEYAKEAVSVLMANGIINGKNGNVDPMANATRAEVAVMLSRVLELTK